MMTKDELLEEIARVKRHTLYPESDGCAMVTSSCLNRWMGAVKSMREIAPDQAEDLGNRLHRQAERICALERDIALLTETLSEAARKVCPDL